MTWNRRVSRGLTKIVERIANSHDPYFKGSVYRHTFFATQVPLELWSGMNWNSLVCYLLLHIHSFLRWLVVRSRLLLEQTNGSGHVSDLTTETLRKIYLPLKIKSDKWMSRHFLAFCPYLSFREFQHVVIPNHMLGAMQAGGFPPEQRTYVLISPTSIIRLTTACILDFSVFQEYGVHACYFHCWKFVKAYIVDAGQFTCSAFILHFSQSAVELNILPSHTQCVVSLLFILLWLLLMSNNMAFLSTFFLVNGAAFSTPATNWCTLLFLAEVPCLLLALKISKLSGTKTRFGCK